MGAIHKCIGFHHAVGRWSSWPRRVSKNGDRGCSHPAEAIRSGFARICDESPLLILVLSARLRSVEGAVHLAAHQSGVSQIQSGLIDALLLEGIERHLSPRNR